MEEKRGEGEWDPNDPGYRAKGESEEAEEWVWQHLGCGGNHRSGNTPNFKGGLAHKTPNTAFPGGLTTKTAHTRKEGHNYRGRSKVSRSSGGDFLTQKGTGKSELGLCRKPEGDRISLGIKSLLSARGYTP